ncbi:hypothetical protein R3W88_016631 [Solanum pinnatisectum]|uniref:Uncharacterized protein n=1 Tax=Solanum pinnatisectum TaxID=50273 RepID=A0AAV9KYP3_9SOLN|nr:hypothetical protein R3W88_016631 [Solanum pinnatisectum]
MVLLQREDSIHEIDRKYPDDTLDSDKERIEGDALSVIQLSIARNMFCEVSISTEEMPKQLWEIMEGLYHDQSMKTRMFYNDIFTHLIWS